MEDSEESTKLLENLKEFDERYEENKLNFEFLKERSILYWKLVRKGKVSYNEALGVINEAISLDSKNPYLLSKKNHFFKFAKKKVEIENHFPQERGGPFRLGSLATCWLQCQENIRRTTNRWK